MTRRYKLFLLVLLGTFSAFAPLINNTLPSDAIAANYGVALSQVNWGLTASMAGLALGQLLFGPLSDRTGRRGIVLATLAMLAIASMLITVAPTLTSFVALRFLQGLGASGGIVLARSIAADNFTGHELVSVIAVTGVICGLAPIVAPLITAATTAVGGWRALFWLLAALGVALLLCSIRLSESLPPERRCRQSLLRTFGQYGQVVRNRNFMAYVLQLCTAEMILFGNIASVALILKDYGYTADVHSSVALSVNGIFVAVGAALAARFGNNARRGVMVSCAGMVALSCVMMAVLWLGLNFWLYEAVLCLLLAFMGISLTLSTSLAMESAREQAGTASALFGAAGFIMGAVVAPLVGLGDARHSTALVFLCGALLSTLFANLSKK